MRRHVLLVAMTTTLGVAGCGQLQNPDVQHGAVTGRIPNAATGAYAYVLGSPALLAAPAADGSFRIDGVPVGASTLVLFDGSAGAEGVPVTVTGASISHVDPGRPLRAAAAVTAGISPLGGVRPVGLAFSVDGTPLQQLKADSGAVRLFPLPAGSFSITATQPGFEDRRTNVSLPQGGEAAFEVDLPVDVQDERRGCLSCGCDHGLACDPDDGRCYPCVKDADCGAGGTCTPSHVCSRPPGDGLLCEACTSSSDCRGVGAGCVNPTQGTLTGFCTLACGGTQDCPSGFDCSGRLCTVQASCATLTASYGSSCLDDQGCQAAIRDGKCFPTNRTSGTAGYCSGRVQAGCPTGFAPDPTGTGYCARLP